MKKNLRSLILGIAGIWVAYTVVPLILMFIEDIPAAIFHKDQIAEVESEVWLINTGEAETLFFCEHEPTILEFSYIKDGLKKDSSPGLSYIKYYFRDYKRQTNHIMAEIHFDNGISVFLFIPLDKLGIPEKDLKSHRISKEDLKSYKISEEELKLFQTLYEMYIGEMSITKSTTATPAVVGFFN